MSWQRTTTAGFDEQGHGSHEVIGYSGLQTALLAGARGGARPWSQAPAPTPGPGFASGEPGAVPAAGCASGSMAGAEAWWQGQHHTALP